MLLEESLEGILEVVTEGQVPQVVHKARETQSLLDEKCSRANRPRRSPLPADRPQSGSGRRQAGRVDTQLWQWTPLCP